MRGATLPVSLLLLALGCAHDPPAAGWRVTRAANSAAVHAPVNESSVTFDLLEDSFVQAFAKAAPAKGKTTLILRAETIPVTKRKSIAFPQDLRSMRQVLPGMTQPLLSAFIAANKQIYVYNEPPADEPLVAAPIELVSGTRIEPLLKGEEGFDLFFKKFPSAHALVIASRPGLDAKRRNALLYFTAATGEAGKGYLVLGRRVDDHWRIVKAATLWSSD